MKKIFLIEDEWVHAEDIRITLEELGYEWLGSTAEGFDAMEKIAELAPDLVLVDLNLNGAFSGINIAKTIKEKFGLPFIFVTSYLDEETIRKCYEVGPLAYLHKPINKGDLKAALLKLEYLENSIPENDIIQSSDLEIMIRVGKNLKPIKKKDILMLQSDAKNYVKLFTDPKTSYTVKASLNHLESQLISSSFMRVHKEFIINLAAITSVNQQEQVIQVGPFAVPLGKNYRNDFFSKYLIL